MITVFIQELNQTFFPMTSFLEIGFWMIGTESLNTLTLTDISIASYLDQLLLFFFPPIPCIRNASMLTIKKPVNDTPCFSTGSTKDCYLVKFKDGSFTGVLCWDALHVALKRNIEQADTNGSPTPAPAKDPKSESFKDAKN